MALCEVPKLVPGTADVLVRVKAAGVIGCSDHLGVESPVLLEFVRQGRLDLSSVITQIVPLEADPVNEALDNLRRFGTGIRTVIVP